jgi:hypothetical protein
MMVVQYGYTESTAIRDIRLMNEVFGPLMTVTREMNKIVAEEMIRQDREAALQMKDIKALNMATSNYIKLHQLDKEEGELPDLSHFEFRQNIIAVLPEQVGINPPSKEVLLEELASKPIVYENGKFKIADAFSGLEHFEFPKPFGKKLVNLICQEEVGTIPLYIKVKNVDEKDYDDQMPRQKVLYDLGLLSKDKIKPIPSEVNTKQTTKCVGNCHFL